MDEIHPVKTPASSGAHAVHVVQSKVEPGSNQVAAVNTGQIALDSVEVAEDGDCVEGIEKENGRNEIDDGSEPTSIQVERDITKLKITLPPVECCSKYDGGKSTVILTVNQELRDFPCLCMVGPDWPCLLYSYFLISFPAIMFLTHVASLLSPYTVLFGLLLLLSTLGMLTITALSDPGIVPKRTDAELEAEGGARGRRMCVWCNVEKLPRMHHCYECNACIEDLDHHCPWTGKCIGKKNLGYFRAYLFLLTALIAYVVVATLVWVVAGTLHTSN